MTRLPTTDLYFLDACGQRVARWWRRAPVRALGANSFQCGDTMLLIRRDSDALMRRALAWPHRLIYLIDDDIAGAADSPGLPADYRRRLADFHRDLHGPLVARADRLVVTSAALRAVHAGHPAVTMIEPFWSLPIAGTDHFRRLGTGVPMRMAHLGTGSHAAGLALLAPVLVRLLDSGRNATLTFVARRGAHPALDAHPRARRIGPMAWPRYRRWLGRQRFHLGLYPLTDTPFDRARSVNKMIEHGIVGALGVYPETWMPARQLGDGAVIAPDAPADWFDRLAACIDDVETAERKTSAASLQLRLINDVAKQRRIWSTLLDTRDVT